jgi:hypothetical protein
VEAHDHKQPLAARLLLRIDLAMSDAEENKPAEGSEPITIRVRDQVSAKK